MNISRKHTTLLAISGLVSSVLFAQKDDVPKGWHMMDKATSGYYGLSVDKAYEFVKTKKLKSKTVIVNAFFASCTGVCPPMNRNLEMVQQSLGERLGRDVFIVSISVDPATDTPPLLRVVMALA